MTETIVKPTRKILTEKFAALLEAANAGGRARTIDLDPAALADQVMRKKAGLIEHDGGGVANSYGYRAESSAIGIAWSTRADRVKVVRMAGARVGCSGRHVTSMNLGTRSQQAKIAAAGMHVILTDRLLMAVYCDELPGAEMFVKAIRKEFGAHTPWLALADWLDDQNRPELYLAPVSFRRLPAPDAAVAAAIRAAFAVPVAAAPAMA